MSAKLLKFLFQLAIILTGCQSARYGLVLPKFTVDGRNYNSLIVDRKPEYGDGKKDGCIVEGQIHLSLFSEESENTFKGSVSDVKDGSPLGGAAIAITQSSGHLTELIRADSVGRFSFSSSAGKIEAIQVNFIGYRTLAIELSKMRFK